VDHRFTVHDVLDPRWLQLGFAVAFAFAMGQLARAEAQLGALRLRVLAEADRSGACA